jgi:arylsulfatase
MELDDNSGRVLQALRDLGIDKDTLVIWTADNGAWIDTWPDAGLQPFRGEKSSAFEGGVRVPCLAWWPGHIKPGSINNDIWTHMDWFPTVAGLAGLPAPPRHWVDNKGKPIVFDGIDLHESLLGTGPGTRDQFIYVNADGGFQGVRMGRFKALWTSHDSWMGVSRQQTLPAIYDLLIDPFEQHDIMMTGSAPSNDALRTSPGRSPLHDHGWVFVELNQIVTDFFAELKEYPNRPEPAAGETLYRAIQKVFGD